MWRLTKEAQQALNPEQAIQLLKDGNERFINNLRLNRNLLQQVNETSQGQFPFATILSCIDSRTSAELIFDQGIGDIFSIRIAGNILNEDILGSMEFACKIAGSKLIVVMGHTQCGAIQGACHHLRLGHLTALLDRITPALELAKKLNPGGSESDPQFIKQVTELHVTLVIEEIQRRSPIIHALVKEKKVGMIGGIYSPETGKVFFNESQVILSS